MNLEEIDIPTTSLDDNGLVTVWSKPEAKWIKRAPIDAKEGIAYGVLSLHAPDDEAQSPVNITTDSIEAYLAGMPKHELRKLCVDHGVSHTSADTKTSLIQRLLIAGVIPD